MRRYLPFFAAVAIAGVLCGCAGRLATSQPVGTPAPSASVASAPHYSIFDRTQTDADALPPELSAMGLDTATIRLAGATDDGIRVFAARNTDGDGCVVLAPKTGVGGGAACSSGPWVKSTIGTQTISLVDDSFDMPAELMKFGPNVYLGEWTP